MHISYRMIYNLSFINNLCKNLFSVSDHVRSCFSCIFSHFYNLHPFESNFSSYVPRLAMYKLKLTRISYEKYSIAHSPNAAKAGRYRNSMFEVYLHIISRNWIMLLRFVYTGFKSNDLPLYEASFDFLNTFLYHQSGVENIFLFLGPQSKLENFLYTAPNKK